MLRIGTGDHSMRNNFNVVTVTVLKLRESYKQNYFKYIFFIFNVMSNCITVQYIRYILVCFIL